MRKGEQLKEVENKRWPMTILLLVLGIAILVPLYMAFVIAIKQPSEMTNDIAGALALPKQWSLSNFSEAIRVTDFWHTAGNSLIITVVSVTLIVLFGAMAAYPIARRKHKMYKGLLAYFLLGMINLIPSVPPCDIESDSPGLSCFLNARIFFKGKFQEASVLQPQFL